MRDNVPCSELPRATLRNRGHRQPARNILSLSLFSLPGPFNRVALFAAQITRESLDGRGPGGLRTEEAPRPPLLILALGD